LGNYGRATEKLTAAREEMNSHVIVLDWCFRLPLHAALTELWLLCGNLTQAREEAAIYLELAHSTEDHTYRALAAEVSARVALAQRELSTAQDLILRGIETVGERYVPLAAWRVHATAASVFESAGRVGLAQSHRRAARTAILALATSLGSRDAVRAKFLSAPIVAGVLGEDTVSAA
jgi:hypothetical protein